MINKINKLFLAFVCFASCLSCKEPARRQLLINDSFVFDRFGRVNNQYPVFYDKEKTVVTYFDNRVIDYVFCDTPKGKIDKIISSYPDWNFIFVIDAQLEDSSTVVHKLNQNECDFPVILDVNHVFKNNNIIDNIMAITFVYKRDRVVNLGVIGSSRSYFDEEFERYNKRFR